jgi:P-type E1-E2 ATPase
LATPLANVLSSLKGLKHGIVYKNMDIISKFKDINIAIFDKTGTLTTGDFEIGLESIYDDTKTPYEIYQIVGAIEANQNHPIAKSFMKKIKELNVQHYIPGKVDVLESLGLTSEINGKTYFIGSKKLLRTLHIEAYYIETGTTLYLVEENKVIAKFVLKDQIAKGAKELVQYLNNRNIQTIMLTGDNKLSADFVAKELGITLYKYDLLPKDKHQIVQQLKDNGKHIMFFGDGINDAPSLSLSDIAVAPYNSSDIASDSSDIYLLSKDLYSVIKMFNLALYTYKIIKLNIIWAFVYNIIAVFFAAGVFIPVGISLEPWMAALAMSASDICVICTSLTINTKKI